MADEGWLQALAGYGLPGTGPLPATIAPVDEVLFDVSGHKLLGVLAAAVAERAYRPGDDGRARIALAHESAMREALLLEEVLLEAVSVLAGAGIDHRVLKGAALAHLVHPDPSERSFGDNDLLVASDDLDAAVAALTAAGGFRPMPPLSASFDRRFAKSVTLRWRSTTELDLHRTLAPGPYGLLVQLDDLWSDPQELVLAGRVLHTLPADLHLVHGALHVALGDVTPRLGNVRDIALLAARPDVDPAVVRAAAARWGCEAPLAVGLQATRRLGHDRSELERWADDYEIGSTDRRLLAAYGSRTGRYRRQALASWRVLGWRDRLAFSRALLRPSAANRAARAPSRRRLDGSPTD